MDTGAYGYPATTVAYEDPAPVVVRRRVGYYGGPVYRSRVAVRRAYGFRSAAIYTPRARFYRPAMYGQRVVHGARPAYRSRMIRSVRAY